MSWQRLVEIARESHLEPGPSACPLCGEPFSLDHNGHRVCPLDGHRPDGEPGPHLPGRDWGGLLAASAEDDRPTPAQSCPNDGQPFTADSDGQLVCPFDGYRPAGAKPRTELEVHPARRISG